MNRAIGVCHGDFGCLCFIELDRLKVLHAHRDAQILFLISGDDVTLKINDSLVTLSKDKSVLLDSFMPHEVHVPKSSNGSKPDVSRILSVYLNPLWFATRFNSDDSEWLSFDKRSFQITENVRDHLDHLVALIQPPRPDKQPEYHLALEARLRHLCSTCFGGEAPFVSLATQQNPLRTADPRVRKSLSIMNEHVRHALALDEVARAAGLSRPHFYRLFRDNLGFTPNVYMNMLRMEYAIERLVFSDQPVTSIALELKFASQASFTRFFGANLGISPTDYRRVAYLPPDKTAAAIAKGINDGAEASENGSGNASPLPNLIGS